MRRFGIVSGVFIAFLLIGASCTFGGTKSGAIFKSENSGAEWRSVSMMTTEKKKVRLSSLDVTRIVIDPRKSNLIFLGTAKNGLFVSDSGGENWVQLIPKESITDIALDPTARCTVYVTTATRVLKTLNCAEEWHIMYNEARANTALTSIAVDPYLPHVLMFSTSAGDVFRSADAGKTWTSVFRHAEGVARIVIDPFDSVIAFLATNRGKIFKSTTRGESWAEVGQGLEALNNGTLAYASFKSMPRTNSVLYASRDAIFRTVNGGETWERIATLLPRDETRITAVEMNPLNEREIHYATTNTLYFSDDNGANWRVTPVPGTRTPGALAIDPNNPRILYLGERTLTRAPGDAFLRFSR